MDTENNNKTRSKDRIRNGKAPAGRSNRLTFMMMRGRGKIRNFQIPFSLFAGILLCLVLYLIVSAVLIRQYFDERSKNRIQAHELERLKDEIEITKKEFYRVRQHLAFLEDYAYQKGAGDDHREESVEPKMPSPKEKPKTVSKESGETVTGEVEKSQVAINDLVMERGIRGLTVRFKLLNIDWGKSTAAGYVHTIARDSQSEPVKVWTFPNVTMENGIPVDYKKGKHFAIKRFMTMNVKYSMEETDAPSSVQVLIYDEAGNVIFDQEYEVGNSS